MNEEAKIREILDSLEFFDHNSGVEHAYFKQTTASLLQLLQEARIEGADLVMAEADKAFKGDNLSEGERAVMYDNIKQIVLSARAELKAKDK